MPLDDKIRQRYVAMRNSEPETVSNIPYYHQNIKGDMIYKKNMRANYRWEKWEDDFILKNRNNKQLSRCLFRTVRAIRERRLNIIKEHKKMNVWREQNRVKYMCKNCNDISPKPGQCDCHTLEYILIPPDHD